ncbi:hypothetical protein ACFV6E_42575 [Streptomyces sp. NPDC059785]|uniref:hypothetical protein n=1 Tax=Streptomyces sp. NPDC059785 TaxID=3346945 RepID=UPI00364D5A9F
MERLTGGRGRSNSAPAILGSVASPSRPDEAEQEERRQRMTAVASDAAVEGVRRGERRELRAAVASDAAVEGVRRGERRELRAAVASDAAVEGVRRGERREMRAAVATDAAAEARRRQEEAAAETRRQREEEQEQQGRRHLVAAAARLKKVTGKVRQIFAIESKADKSKKILDLPDTAVNRIITPSEGGFRSQAQAASNTSQLQDAAVIAQVGVGVNTLTDLLGVLNDGRALKSAYKGRNGTGPGSHKPRKDLKGKSLGLVQNTGMVVGDISSTANTAVRNIGHLGGVPVLGELTGGASAFYSTVMAIRDVPAVWNAYSKNRALGDMIAAAPEGASGAGNRLQDVLDQMGQVQDQLTRARAQREQGGSRPEGSGAAAARIAAVADFEAQVADLTGQLKAELLRVGRYAQHKQHTRMAKRVTNFGGNTVRAAGGGLAIAAAAGAVSGPAAPAVAGVAAAMLLGNAAYKGIRAGSNRYVAARHPDRWARPTSAQGASGTEQTEAPAAEGVGRGDALKEFFKVTKSVQQGERHFMAQELYALAAGPNVPVGRNVPDDVRQSARALLVILKAGPSQHNQSQEEWAASLDDPEQQTAWEKEITNQLSSA